MGVKGSHMKGKTNKGKHRLIGKGKTKGFKRAGKALGQVIDQSSDATRQGERNEVKVEAESEWR